jgi:RHS repeat-associated protein
VKGDLVTSNGTVDLVTKTQAGNSVTLDGRTVVAAANGVATFTGVALALGGNDLSFTITDGSSTTSYQTQIIRTNPDDVILTWNHITLDTIRRELISPPAASRLLAMVHTAMYDAVNAIEQKYNVYRVDAGNASGDANAAAAAAAAKILNTIYPNQQAYINATLDSYTAANTSQIQAGVALGNTVAANILAWRQQDGARTQLAYNPSTEVGKWQPDLPNFDGALLPNWRNVTTFGLSSGAQFRPNGLPALDSTEYAQAWAETKEYGALNSSTRNAEQTQIALFWADGNGTYTPSGHWNDIAATAASMAGKSVLDNARTFARLNVALADAGIAAWDAKYTYDTWRPITAIRNADDDGNTNTTADPNWLPLINTPPFPEYVSGHSTFSGAASAVLTAAFGSNFGFSTGSVGLPDTTRSYTNFAAAAAEAGQSRIYGGIHFQFANRDGLALGKQIGEYVVNNFLGDPNAQTIRVGLTADTAAFGTTNRDRITNNASISGQLTSAPAGARLSVKIDNGGFVTIPLNGDGSFQLDNSQLAAINGGTLPDRAYRLAWQLVDGNGTIIGTNNLDFTLDRSAPTVNINSLDRITPTGHLTGTAVDPNGSTSGRFRVDSGNWVSFNSLPNGTFNKAIDPAGLSAGNHSIELEIADLAGNITARSLSFNVDNSSNIYASPGTNPGWGRLFANGFSLGEGNSLIVQNTIDLTLGGSGKRTLDFDLATSFDKSDTKSFGKDRVAVYLVDNSGNPIDLDSTHPGGTPLFSLSETGAEIIPGLVKFDGTHVQIDVSNVAATNGKLVLQLLNLDGDTGSNVTVTNFVNAIDPDGTPGNSVSPAVAPVAPGAAKVLDSYLATNNAQILLSNVSLDKNTGKYTAELRVQNVGTTTLSRNLAILLTGLPSGVSVANGSGTHPGGSPYLNFDPTIPTGGLGAGAISDALRVEINDPTLVAFSFKPVVLAGAPDVAPDLSSLATLTVKVGDKLDIPLMGLNDLTIANAGKLPIGELTGDNHLIFKPAPNQIGSYTFTLIAKNGGAETRQNVTLNVVADPITTTRISGTIASTNQAALAGVLVELSGYQATTDANGKFTITLPTGAAGDTLKVYGQRIQVGGITYPFIAEKMGLLLGHDIYQGTNNQIDRPIYLPTIDVSTGTTVNPAQTTVVTNPNLAGAQVTVAANSLFDKSGNAFAGVVSITQVPPSLTPAALPETLHPDLVVTVQPGDMVFNTPARISLPNTNNLAAGTELDLWSINPNTGEFDKVGKGRVSADGRTIDTIEGGIRNSSWHFFGLPPFEPAPGNNPTPGCPGCQAGQPINSEVILQTGEVKETHDLITYQSLGETRGISLTYNSLRADTRPIVHLAFNNVDTSFVSAGDRELLRLVAKLSVTGDNGFTYQVPGYGGGKGLSGGENFWKIPAGGGRVDAALQLDLRSQASGIYDYSLDSGILGIGPGGNFFGSTAISTGKVLIVNNANSAFGSGWSLNGLQNIVKNKDGSALLIDGDGQELWFKAGQIAGSYTSPTGDFSTLERLGDGTFRRTLNDGTVYQFDNRDRLASMTDRQSNTTQYRYDLTTGNLTQIVDPIGLATNFNYTGNRITSIVDPAGRTTQMEYDAGGNLIKITDPDRTYRQWEYDSAHHMTAAVDKTGNRGEDYYDFAGRAYKGVRPDGSMVQINPIEVQGLYNPKLTVNPDTAPTAVGLSSIPKATYFDGNGNPIVDTIDTYGQSTNNRDGVGQIGSTARNDRNLVTQTLSPTGAKVDYLYDERGNLIGVRDLLSSAGDALSFDGNNDYVRLANGSPTVGDLSASTWDGWVKFDSSVGDRTIYNETSTDGTIYKLELIDSTLRWAIGKEGVVGQWQYVEVPLQLNTPTAAVAVDLVVTDLKTTQSNESWGQNINLSWTVTNRGSGKTNANWFDSIWLSDKNYWDSTAIYLGQRSIQQTLAAGESYTANQTVNVPLPYVDKQHVLVTTDRAYYDPNIFNNTQAEANEDNNTRAIAPLTAPDLVVTDLKNNTTNASWGQSIDLSWTVTNQGSGKANANRYDSIWLSDKNYWDSTAIYLGQRSIQQTLAAGESYTANQTVNVPLPYVDKQHVLVTTDRAYYDPNIFNNTQAEANEDNNTRAIAPLTAPDLVVTDLKNNTTNASWGQSIDLSWTVTNQGSGKANANRYDSIWLSDKNYWDSTAIYLGQRSIQQTLAAGESYTANQTVNVSNFYAGKQHVLITTDRASSGFNIFNNTQSESNEDNNTRALLALGTIPPADPNLSDLAITTLTVPSDVTWGQTTPISWTVTNQGNNNAVGSWYDYVYASNDDVFDLNDTFISATLRTDLAAGASYTVSQNLPLPLSAQGKSHLLVVNDRENFLKESNDNNNVRAVTIDSQPDLVVLEATVPDGATWGDKISVAWTVANIGPAVAVNDWYDYVYVSTDDKLDINDNLVAYVSAADKSPLGKGESYTITKEISLPDLNYPKPYLLFVTDRDRAQLESNEINNVKAVEALVAPDLIVSSATASPIVNDPTRLNFNWTVKNQSDRAAKSDWYDYIYASSTNSIDANAIVIGKVKRPNSAPLAGGDSYTSSLEIDLPTTAAGKPYFFIVTDGNYDRIETDDTNNSRLATQGGSTWLHLAAVLDPTAGMQLYVNGQLKSTASTSLRRTSTATATFSSATSSFNGQLDEVRLWNIALTPTQIQANAGQSIADNTPGLISYYHFDEGTGTTVTDSISSKTSTLTNGTAWAGINAPIVNDRDGVGMKRYTYDTKFNQLTSVTDELGRKTLYDLDTNTGNVLKTTQIVGQLDSIANGETDDVVTNYTYTSSGQVDLLVDALGRTTDYDYDTSGHLIKTTTAKGTTDQAIEEYEYDVAGNKTADIDALGRRTTYTYNSSNMLLQTTDAKGGTTTSSYDKMGHRTSLTDALGHVTKMTYNNRGWLASILDTEGGLSTNAYDNNGNLITATDALGRISTFKYDARNRLIASTAADGGTSQSKYDLSDNLTGTIDSLGNQTKRFYDTRNRLVKTIDALGNETKHSYNAANELIATTDAKGNITQYRYDDLGRQIAIIDALGHTSHTEYDKLGNVKATVDANGNRTEYKYDALNRQIEVKDAKGEVTKTTYDRVGNILSVTDPLTHTTSFDYDVLNRQISVTDALGYASTTAYDAVGNVLSTTDALGRTTKYGYDNLNRRILMTDALLQTQSTTYDKVGNVLSTTDRLGRTTNYGYDRVNRQTSITDPLLHTSTTSYDTEGNVTSTTDAIGNTTNYLYDKNNRQIQVIDAELGVTATDYDEVGNVSSITDSVGNTTSDTYDRVNRLITDTNQLGKTRTRSYDNVGNLTQTIDRDGRKIAYTYDTLNRQTAERWLDSSGATIKTFGSTYDAIGRLVSMTNPDSTYIYSYDAIDRVVSIDNTGTVGVPAVKFNYTYDAVGNLLTVNDIINGTSAGITGYTYDLLNRLTKLTQAGTGVQSKRVDMAYNAVNQLTLLSRYSGVNLVADTNFVHDTNQRLIQLSHKKGASSIASYDYSYDVADKLERTVSSVDGTSDYSYDATNQLTGADNTTQPDEAYSYDANGNRTIAGYMTGANNQLLSDGTYNYTYDGEGNRTKRTEIATGKVTEYVWDYRNRLSSVMFKDAGGVVTKSIDYIYDGNDQRIGQKLNGVVTERYVLDRNQIALVFDGSGTQTHRYLYGTQIDQVLSDETPTGMVWALADRQGTVGDLVDNSGSAVNHITYDSFGKVVSQTNPGVVFRYGYTGREADDETGLNYYRARYYDAGVGRFISEDPIGFGAGDTNLYRYVGNSSVNGTDPTGLLVNAIYDITTGTLTVTDNNTKKTSVFYDLFSGDNSPSSENDSRFGPIPRGRYEILIGPQRKEDKTPWFRLDPIDENPRNDRSEKNGRTYFRLHPGTMSEGCITFPKDRVDEWRKVYSTITGTITEIVDDNRPWEDQGIIGRLQTFVSVGLLKQTTYKYGELTVIASPGKYKKKPKNNCDMCQNR